MSETTSKRVKGHVLMFEGDPHDINGARLPRHRAGRGKCSCGALSTTLFSAYARKGWHREHKAEILAASGPMETPTQEPKP